MLEEGLSILEEGIVKAKMILDGYPTRALFTAEEYMKFYDCVYYMCIQQQPCDYSLQLYQRFTRALEESISSKILPSLEGKNGASLLKELTNMWANYKLMAKCLGGFFLYLDRPYKTSTSLSDVSIRCFRNLVCDVHYQRLQDAAISLVLQWQLMGHTASKLIEKQKAENQDLPTYQELLSRYGSMSLGDGTSTSPSQELLSRYGSMSLGDGASASASASQDWPISQ